MANGLPIRLTVEIVESNAVLAWQHLAGANARQSKAPLTAVLVTTHLLTEIAKIRASNPKAVFMFLPGLRKPDIEKLTIVNFIDNKKIMGFKPNAMRAI